MGFQRQASEDDELMTLIISSRLSLPRQCLVHPVLHLPLLELVWLAGLEFGTHLCHTTVTEEVNW